MLTAAHPQPLPDVTPLATAMTHGNGYCRRYRVVLQPGACLLQRVRVHARFLQGGVRLVDYRQTYYEFFAADHDLDRAVSAIDEHDFDVVRDGWRQAVMLSLWRNGRRGAPAMPPGEAVLQVKKQFTLGPGQVDASHLGVAVDGGARFGLLQHGPGGSSRTRLMVQNADGTRREVPSLRAAPPGYAIAGRGIFTAARGLRAFESFVYRYATQTGRFADNGSYRPGVLE